MLLALELASARLNVLTIQEIASRLNDRFILLTAGTRRGIDPRHYTLRATIDWSYDLLKDDEQALLRRMAVFTAGCTLDMLEAYYASELQPEETTINLISSLVIKSLVVAETTGKAQIRYRLLEKIRQYLLEKLDQSGEAETWRDRHLDLYLKWVEEAAPKLTGTYQQMWLNWLEGEHDNLRAALAWSLASSRIEPGLRIVIALVPFWEIRGYMRECQTWYRHLLAQTDDTISLDIQVNALVNAAYIDMAEGNFQASEAYGREAVQVAEASGDNALLSFALNFLGASAQAAGDHQTAFTVVERAIPLYRECGPPYHLRMALYLSGENAVQSGKYELARKRLNESLALCQEDGDSYHIANIYNALGDLARLEQDYVSAASAYEKGAALLRELDALDNLALILGNLGFTYLYLGKIEQATTCFNECMAIHLAQQNKHGQIECLIGFGATAVKRGQTASGVRLLAAAALINRQPSGSHWKANRMEFKRYNDLAHTKLTESEYLAEQAAGRIMSLEQAVEYAKNLPLRPGSIIAHKGKLDSLTNREREVAALIGQGKSNNIIAQELVLSKRTVEKHAANILSKLGLTSRSQIVRWAIEQDLTKASQ